MHFALLFAFSSSELTTNAPRFTSNAGFGELGHRSRFNSASGTVNSATSVRVNSVEPDSV
jgi:hypothetical protein